jgi:transcriptional regulator PpsR
MQDEEGSLQSRPARHETGPGEAVGPLSPDAAGAVIAAGSDIAFLVDPQGVLQACSLGHDPSLSALRGFVGSALVDTVGVESRDKVPSLLEAPADGRPGRWHQINHVLPSGMQVPIKYRALRIDADRVLIAGRDLRPLAAVQARLTETEQAISRDYARIVAFERRYRAFFEDSAEAMAVVEPSTGVILEANAAFARLAQRRASSLIGSDATAIFEPDSRDRISTMLSGIRLTARTEPTTVALESDGAAVLVSLQLVREEGRLRCLLRLTRYAEPARPAQGESRAILAAFERLPDAVAVTDLERRLRYANGAFLELAQASIFEQVRDQPIERWLGRSPSEVEAAIAAARRDGTHSGAVMQMRGEFGAREDVMLSVVVVEDDAHPVIGFTLRVLRRPASEDDRDAPLVGTPAALRELVGRLSLGEMVRRTTDEIERLCIEAALRISGDNRAAAAALLGLSRQGLYAKLSRYRVGRGDAGAEAEDVPDTVKSD